MKQAKIMENKIKANYVSDDKFVNDYTSNVKSDLIEITEDKLENILLKHLNKLNTNQMWITPLSLFITIILVIITATFSTKIGIDKSVWEAIFYIAALITFIWSIISGLKAFNNNDTSIECLIKKIKNKENN